MRYYKGKEVHLIGSTEPTTIDKILLWITIIVNLVVFGIGFYYKNILICFLSFVPSIIFITYIIIKYFFIKKIPKIYQSYDIEIKNDDVNITNYKEKIIDKK